MRIILESELEKEAWGIMMSAHFKWEKNYGNTLLDQMDWYFDKLFNEETEGMVKQEVERRLRENWPEYYGLSEVEYVKKEMDDLEDDLTEVEKEQWKMDLREDYIATQEVIAEENEDLTETVRDELRNCYYTFFNAPEKLAVVYNGEIIQKAI